MNHKLYEHLVSLMLVGLFLVGCQATGAPPDLVNGNIMQLQPLTTCRCSGGMEMTRDEILEMEAGREMDALIWKLLNGRDLEMGTLDCRHVDGDVQPHSGIANLGHVSPLQYSTRIDQAWLIVEAIVEKLSRPGPLGGERFARLQLYHGRIQARDYNEGYIGAAIIKRRGKRDISVYASADTAPLAICRAALLVTMELDE